MKQFTSVEERRARLRMTKQVLAKRAGLSYSKLKRVYARPESLRLDELQALGRAVGLNFELVSEETFSEHELRKKEANDKARFIVELTQGTSQLEGQGLDPDVIEELTEVNMHTLMAGPPSRLWG